MTATGHKDFMLFPAIAARAPAANNPFVHTIERLSGKSRPLPNGVGLPIPPAFYGKWKNNLVSFRKIE